MYGLGILKSFSVTLRRLLMTYWDDIQYSGRRSLAGLWAGYWSRYLPPQQKPKERGIFTVQYPRERLPLPENFRTFPFLVLDPRTGKPRCRACGACARACPPQCIWIDRDETPEGKPMKRPRNFSIDATICMSCGLCAEFCPFDAIKMDNNYELSAYDRYTDLVFHKDRLLRPVEYYAKVLPTQHAAHEEKIRQREEKRRQAAAAKAQRAQAAAAKEAEQ